jgi:hypothetical protein
MGSSRRAHRGGLSLDGKTHAIFARRQLEHGDALSHLTLRVRHVTQLRSFGAGAPVDADANMVLPGDAPAVALFSEAEAEAGTPCPPKVPGVAAEIVTAGTCDIAESGDELPCSLVSPISAL